MNERIKELAEQARDYVADAIELGFPQDQIDDIRDEKFAELIVRECIDVVKPTPDHEVWAQSYLGGVDGLELLDSRVEKIKQHFGVEG